MVCETLEEFEKRWQGVCNKVEKKSLDRHAAKGIADSFLDEAMIFGRQREDEGKPGDIIHAMMEITNSLNVSLQIAISNYERFAKPSWFQKLFGKPEVNIDVNAIKNKFG